MGVPVCTISLFQKENNISLIYLFKHLGFNLFELEDWNCCGSSSAHSINTGLAFDLACRNLFLAPPGRPLLVACPSCLLRLRHAHHTLTEDAGARSHFERKWGEPFNADLEIVHVFETLGSLDLLGFSKDHAQRMVRQASGRSAPPAKGHASFGLTAPSHLSKPMESYLIFVNRNDFIIKRLKINN